MTEFYGGSIRCPICLDGNILAPIIFKCSHVCCFPCALRMIYSPFVQVPELNVPEFDTLSVEVLKPVIIKIAKSIIDASGPLRVSSIECNDFIPASNKSFTCPICSQYSKAQDLLPVKVYKVHEEEREIVYTKGNKVQIRSDLDYYSYLDDTGPLFGTEYAEFTKNGLMDPIELQSIYNSYATDISDAMDGVIKDISDRLYSELDLRLSTTSTITNENDNSSWAAIAKKNTHSKSVLDLSLSGIFKDLMRQNDNILYSSVIACSMYTFSINLCLLRSKLVISNEFQSLVSRIKCSEYTIVSNDVLHYNYTCTDASVPFEDTLQLLDMYDSPPLSLKGIGRIEIVGKDRLFIMRTVDDKSFNTTFKSTPSSPKSPRMLSDLIEAQLGVK